MGNWHPKARAQHQTANPILKELLDYWFGFLLVKQMLDHSTDLDNIFQALADPTRRAIVEQLGDGPKSVSEIALPLDMTLAAVVQHVQLLENCQLITTQKQGRVRTCRIKPETLKTLESWLNQRRRQWEQHFDRLAAVLDEQSPKRKKP